MNIQVHHQNPPDPAFSQQHMGGDGYIVEHAEACSVSFCGMMTATGGVARKAPFQCDPGTQQGSTTGQPGPPAHPFRHRQADPPFGGPVEPAIQNRIHIGPVMGEVEPLPGHGLGHQKCTRARKAVLDQHIPKAAELGHGKPVAVGQICDIIRVVSDGQLRFHGTKSAHFRALRQAPIPVQSVTANPGNPAMQAKPEASPTPINRAEVWRLAWPIMVSNLAVPLLGLSDTAVIGNVGTASSLAAIAIGSVLFSFLYTGFNFLRMGTTGLVSQAFGAGDRAELRAALARALLIALGLAALLLALQPLIQRFALPLFAADPETSDLAATYFAIRIWSAPAALAQFAILGWFIGAQDSRPVLVLQLFLHLTNIALNLLLVLVFDLDVAGVALGTLIAEWLTVGLGLWMIRRALRSEGGGSRTDDSGALAQADQPRQSVTWGQILRPDALLRTFAVNGDILIRTWLLMLSFAWFTAQSGQLGTTQLAANHVLLQFLAFSSYFLDGWAIAAESLVGRALGRGNRDQFDRAVRHSTELAVATSLLLTVLLFALGPLAIRGLTDIEDVRAAAIAFLPFAALHPVLGVWAFQLDGIFVGATRTKAMRNSMLISTLIFLALTVLLSETGNTGLWIAFLAFFLLRGLTLSLWLPGLRLSVDPRPQPR